AESVVTFGLPLSGSSRAARARPQMRRANRGEKVRVMAFSGCRAMFGDPAILARRGPARESAPFSACSTMDNLSLAGNSRACRTLAREPLADQTRHRRLAEVAGVRPRQRIGVAFERVGGRVRDGSIQADLGFDHSSPVATPLVWCYVSCGGSTTR